VDPHSDQNGFRKPAEQCLQILRARSDPVKISMERRAAEVVVRIEDHGIGIPQEELAHIFEPFYRVDKSRSKDTGGYGLGLSLCQTIMEAHEGKIEVQSQLKEGTTVLLFFPYTKS